MPRCDAAMLNSAACEHCEAAADSLARRPTKVPHRSPGSTCCCRSALMAVCFLCRHQRSGPHRTRRASLRCDRPRHGPHRRLGHAAPERPALVRKAAALLLAGGRSVPRIRRRRICHAPAFGLGGRAGHAGRRLGRAPRLRARRSHVHAADAAGHHRADRLFPLGRARHAFRRAPRRHGGGRCRNAAVETPGHAIEDRLRFSAGRRHPGKRSCGRAPGGRGRSSVVPVARANSARHFVFSIRRACWRSPSRQSRGTRSAPLAIPISSASSSSNTTSSAI